MLLVTSTVLQFFCDDGSLQDFTEGLEGIETATDYVLLLAADNQNGL